MMRSLSATMVLCLSAALVLPARAATHVIAPDGSGDFPTIQAAVDAAVEGDTILLSHGIFTGPGNRDIDLRGKALLISSRSGDPESATIDCQGSPGAAHRGFRCHAGEGSATVIAGLTIIHGYVEAPDGFGGAILCSNGSAPVFKHCILANNRAQSGGAVATSGAGVELRDCCLRDNVAGVGGAASAFASSHMLRLVGCTLQGNSASAGGAINSNEGDVELQDCTLTQNDGHGHAVVNLVNHSSLGMDAVILAFSPSGDPVNCDATSTVAVECCDIFGNLDGDWIGPLAGHLGINGNISADPLFCSQGAPEAPLGLWSFSPCAPGATPGCDLIGAWPVTCEAILVRPDGTGDYPTTQAAIDAALPGEAICLTGGVYKGPGNRDIDFRGKDIAVLSQYLDVDDVVIDCQGLGRGFYFHSGEGAGASLRGLTIIRGAGTDGGGICIQGADPIITRCILADNWAARGGALFVEDGSPRVTQCTFARNGAEAGGGLYCGPGAAVEIDYSIIAFSTGGGAMAGTGGMATPAYCDFYGNIGGDWTGASIVSPRERGNFSADPLFCGGDHFGLREGSPCAPVVSSDERHPTIGAAEPGCMGEVLVITPGGGQTPHATIQAAIEGAAHGDTVQLSDGWYRGPGNRNLRFLGKAITLASRGGRPEHCVIDAEGLAQGVRFCDGEGPGSVLQRVTLTNCRKEGGRGGGVQCLNTSPTIRGCVLRSNYATWGGGVYSGPVGYGYGTGAARIEDCLFEYNDADMGGAIACLGRADAILRCIVRSNGHEGETSGGGITAYGDAIVIQECLIADNRAGDGGGFEGWAEIRDCELVDNEAYSGGAMVYYGSDEPISGCRIVGNSAEWGAAVYCPDGSYADFQNCTLYGNVGRTPTSAVFFAYQSTIDLMNCLVGFNDARAVDHEGTGHHPAYARASCCDIYGNTGGDYIDLLAGQLGQAGNICEDPLFCDPAHLDLRLQPDSPCAPFTPPNPQCDRIGSEAVGCRATDEARPLLRPLLPRVPARPSPNLRVGLKTATPNPFARDTRITFCVPQEATGRLVVLRVFDVAGRTVRTLIDQPLGSGCHDCCWDATGDAGEQVASGVYLCRLECGTLVSQRTIVKVR